MEGGRGQGGNLPFALDVWAKGKKKGDGGTGEGDSSTEEIDKLIERFSALKI